MDSESDCLLFREIIHGVAHQKTVGGCPEIKGGQILNENTAIPLNEMKCERIVSA